MRYFLSTIGDVTFEESAGWKMKYVHHALPVAKEFGLGLEVCEFCITENLDEKRDEIMPFFLENVQGASAVILHAPFNELYPHAIEPKVREVAMERLSDIYRLAREIGAEKMVVHANFVESLYHPDWFVEKQIAFWREFLEKNEGETVLVLENVMEQSPEMLVKIAAGVSDSRLRLCLDLGHANLTKTPVSTWISECAPYLSHYHIHNNHGPVEAGPASGGDLHRAVFDGAMDMEALLRLAEKLTPDATATVECNEVKSSSEWLKEKGFI